MPVIQINFDRSLWEAKLGSSQKVDDFLADITTFNASEISVAQDVTVSISDVASGSLHMSWDSPAAIQGFDFNEVLTTDWGKRFLKIFEKHNVKIN